MNDRTSSPLGVRDERRHDLVGADAIETWTLDFVQADGTVAGAFWLTFAGPSRIAAFHAAIVRPELALVTLSETSAAVPRPPGLELRSPGLWTEIGIQTPGDHVALDLEAFAVALDDPDEVFGRAYGDRVALGGEIEWEQETPVVAGDFGYALGCRVHGELLLGADVIELDGWGWRSHYWDEAGYVFPTPVRGRAGDGGWWHGLLPDPLVAAGATIGRAPIARLVDGVDVAIEQRLVRLADGAVAWTRSPI